METILDEIGHVPEIAMGRGEHFLRGREHGNLSGLYCCLVLLLSGPRFGPRLGGADLCAKRTLGIPG